MRTRGFTLLEMLVATVILGIAVVGLLSNISTSLSNASRLTDYDRAALVAKRKMDELLLDPHLPRFTVVEGKFDPATSAGLEGGWRAQLTPFEMPPQASPGTPVLDRLELQIFWMNGLRQRTLTLEGYRRSIVETGGATPGGAF
jgi:general secretion pathway protein I